MACVVPDRPFGSLREPLRASRHPVRLGGRRRPGGIHPNRTDAGGIGQETEIPIFATLRYKPTPKIELDLNGGVAVAGNVRVEDKDGGRIADDSYKPAGILAFKGQFFF